MVQQEEHLHLSQALPQALAHPKAEGQVLETPIPLQPALGQVVLGPRKYCRVSAHGVETHVEDRL